MPGPKYSKLQRERFFDLLDRGGTVRAAAAAVGVHPGAAYSLVAASGRYGDAAGQSEGVFGGGEG
jgi:IS30 family transposase